MERVEDYNMGNELRVFGGFMGKRTGSDRDRWIYNLTNQQGYRWAPGQFMLAQIGATGRTVGGGWDNSLLFANANLVWKTDWRYEQTWVSHFEMAVGRELDGENQIILGGENGLRGYKNNSFVGAKSILGNIENRFFFPREYFHLIKLGGTIFFDSGTVVPEGSGFSLTRAKSDVGFGLRIASTRSRSGGVFRIDVAYALDKGPAGGRVVVAIRGGQSFDFFNSSARRVRQTQPSRLNEISSSFRRSGDRAEWRLRKAIMRAAVPPAAALALSSGCSLNTLALRTTTGLMEKGAAPYHEEPTPARQGKDASQLKFVEALLRSEPGNAKLLLLSAEACRLHFPISGGCSPRGQGVYVRGRDHGLRGWRAIRRALRRGPAAGSRRKGWPRRRSPTRWLLAGGLAGGSSTCHATPPPWPTCPKPWP